MCGLCGSFSASQLTSAQRTRRARVTEALLMANASRGTDATGVALVREDGGLDIYKKPVNSYGFVEQPRVNALLRDTDARLILGHTRLGTIGQNTEKNAHPFREGNVVGAHNGMIWNHRSVSDMLTKRWKKPHQVDSQVIFRLLNDIGAPDGESYASLLPLLQGSMALTWWHKLDPNALWIMAHDNPLHLAEVPRLGLVYWSSESTHLHTVMQAAYGREWYTCAVDVGNLNRLVFEDGRLTWTSWKVDMRDSWYGTYESKAATTTKASKPSGNTYKSYELDRCDMCGREDDPDEMVWDRHEDMILCKTCDQWWESEGSDRYRGDLEVAVASAQTSGKHLPQLLGMS